MLCHLCLVLIAIAVGVQSRTGAPNPRKCFPRPSSLYFNVSRVDKTIFMVPVGDVVDCLTKVRIDMDFALDAVDSYNNILQAGYGYYYYSNDVLESSPIENPFGWEIFNGTSGGQVDYDKEFQALREDIEAKGHADGMLAYKINDILLRAKDGHTSGIELELDILSLLDEDPGAVRSWLSLQMDERAMARVVNNIHVNSSIFDAEIRVVKSINGENPLSYLDELVSNPAIGSQSQYKSPGVRMNVFLDNCNFTTPIHKWTGVSLGDISNLPTGLMLEYEDGFSSNWTFVVWVPEKYMYSTPEEIGETLTRESPLYSGFKEFKDGKRMIDSQREKLTRSQMVKRNLIIHDEQLGFKQFRATSLATGKFATYSGYLVREDTMVWKLPSFAANEDAEDLVHFWNAMAAGAQNKKIDKLIIDISNNAGGYLDNVVVCLKLLYPDARTEDVLPISNTRITDVMYNMDRIATAALDINQKVSWSNVTNALFNIFSERERIQALSSMCTPLLNFKALTQGTDVENLGNLDWYSLGSTMNSSSNLCEKDMTMWSEADAIEFFEATFASFVPPCSSPNISSDNCKVEVIKSIQSGIPVPVTKGYPYDISEFDFLGDMDEYLSRGEILKSPFKSYVLFSNSANVGSGAHLFLITLLSLSHKYKSLQNLTTVSMGCMGNQLECAMASFAGQVVRGSPWIREIYGLFAVSGSVKTIIEIDSMLKHSRVTSEDLDAYTRAYRKLQDSLPMPPALSSDLPQFASRPFFYNGIPPNSTLPVEYFNIPANKYIPFWPPPRTTTFENQASLGYIYDKLLTMFP
ncbi:hypothetical protein PSENEW3_00003234 [Picochlorum sp. SENEW3]|nr:hypothetical protein PSENEW3_00003234 [Picochlorum sp. SENEW3]